MRLLNFLCLGGLLLSGVVAESHAQDRLLAFAVDNTLSFFVGKWSPEKGWVQALDFYQPPDPGAPVSLFGMEGKLAEVTITDDRRASASDTPQDWSASISRWQSAGEPYALAMMGHWPAPPHVARVRPLDDPEARQIVSDFLKTQKRVVPQPILTQVFEVDLNGSGPKAELICAHSDANALKNDQPAILYSLALVHTRGAQARTWPLAVQTSYKPAMRSLEDHRRLYGTDDVYRWVAFVDIEGDGRQQIVLSRTQVEGQGVDVFAWDRGSFTKVLSTYRPF